METKMHPEDIDFQKYFRILKQYWLPGILVWNIPIILSIITLANSEDVYQASGKLLLKKRDPTPSLISSGNTSELGTLESLSNTTTPLDTEKEILLSNPIVEKTIQASNLNDEEGQPLTYEDFIENLSVKNEPGTDVLRIRYESTDPQEAESVVNNLMRNYIDNNITTNRAGAAAARDFINQQLPIAEAELRGAENAIRLFKEAYLILDPNTESTEVTRQINSVNSRVDTIKAELVRITGQVSALQGTVDIDINEALTLNILNQEDSGVQKVLTELQLVEDQLIVTRAEFTDQSPVVIDLENKRLALETQLNNRIFEVIGRSEDVPSQILQAGDLQKELSANLIRSEINRQGLLDELAFLEKQLAFLNLRTREIPRLEQEYTELVRQLESAQIAYNTLATSLQRTRIIESQSIGNVEIISPAVISPDPISSGSKKIVITGFLIGGFLYVITAFVCNLLDPRLRTDKELSQLFNYPLLGEIPLGSRGLYPYNLDSDSDTDISDILRISTISYLDAVSVAAYREIRDRIKDLIADKNIKTFAVTSFLNDEGKSTISANLAAAISELGSRVLLIDGNLHNPSQNKIWRQPVLEGLGNLLLGNIQWQHTKQKINPNLDLLLAGHCSLDTSLLIGSERMNKLIQHLKGEYDLIIIDTPPIHQYPESLSLGRMTDGTLLVSRLGMINNSQVIAAKELLKKSNQNILGLIINSQKTLNEVDEDSQSADQNRQKILEFH
ncbi:lipopolysaccharide biosynthesis protein [Leptolyngbya sp. Heron Island J]|uniref:GumC family protein n=1 Tax=Leptolyngbya sp. Heron Island J TaxID=1385935 RepID=UPI0003B9C4C4|nr:polysaccharide biosynthesis tyrosine autokinase [Leptolyngbya sp. Heron Island J]ESA37254.1 lipopolysaccharide biosynthesis protein [Leptolyngbya sp. Heron Island J]